jgi:thiamine phosphate synthase YjbQ (UPF0047 family)
LNGKFLSDNYISIKAAKETQGLHNTAFDKMQNSFSIFTDKVIGIITLFGIFIGGFTIFISVSSSNQVKELKKDMREDMNKFDNKIIEEELKK